MKNKPLSFAIIFFLLLICSATSVSAWGRGTHDFVCPEEYSTNCNVADYPEFQENYPFANSIYHLCYDNKEDCVSRLVAKYFLKKYYTEGESDKELLGAAAHLFQDASCPGHWYPGFKILGRDTYLFAPKWTKDIEWRVDSKLESHEENWNINIENHEETIGINENYLDNLKKDVSEFLSQEPNESLESIESKIKSEIKWHYLRAYQSFIIILFFIFIPVLGFELWKYKKEKITSSDLIIVGTASVILFLLFVLIKIFY